MEGHQRADRLLLAPGSLPCGRRGVEHHVLVITTAATIPALRPKAATHQRPAPEVAEMTRTGIALSLS